jgi:hypothetical protein
MPAVYMALGLARPNVDSVNLIMFVSNESAREFGKYCIQKVMDRIPRSHVRVEMEVLIRGSRSLLESIQQYVIEHHVDLVVTSSGLVSTHQHSPYHGAILGSVALAIFKRLEIPVLLVNPGSLQSASSFKDQKRVRLMMMVEPWAMSLLDYTMERLILPGRGDKLFLGQIFSQRSSTSQQRNAYQCLMNDVSEIVGCNHIEHTEVFIDGYNYSALRQTVEEHAINLLALQLPPGSKSLSKDLLQLLGQVHCGVLLMKGLET